MSCQELPFIRQFLLTCEDYLLGELMLLIYLYPLVEKIGRPAPGGGWIRRHPLLIFTLLPAALAPAMAAVNWWAAGFIRNLPLICLIFMLTTAAFTLWSMWVWQGPFWQSLCAVSIAAMLQSSMSHLFNYVLGAVIPLARLEETGAGISLLVIWPTLPVHLALSMALKGLWTGEGFRPFSRRKIFGPNRPAGKRSTGEALWGKADGRTDNGKNSGEGFAGKKGIRRIALMLVALEVVFAAMHYLQFGIESRYLAESLIVWMALMLLVTALVVSMARREMDRRQIQLQRDVIAQQTLYEQSLEELRREMRCLRHDYKNLLAGYGKGSEAGAISRSMQELEEGFDRRLGEKIRNSLWIGNVRIPQVRSLLLAGLTEMTEKGVECRLEVLCPVERAYMELPDLIRCLGILMDNALEAALETERPWVEILLLQEEDVLTIRISNPWLENTDPERFWEEGFSSRGKGRGIGLFSYQRILKRYPGALAATRWSDGVFVQELTIGGRL